MTVVSWTRANLEQLLGQEEGSSLEFKRSLALENTDGHKKELVKDVTALANAAGGIIVYGIEEQNGTAISIDEGIDVAPEWIEQVLESNAEPKVLGVTVQRIPLAAGRYAFAIEVPQATALAPHQSKQHYQYFRRHGRKVLPMLDHEVRDLMRRGAAPELFLDFSLTRIADDTYDLDVAIGNRSPAPAEYGVVHLGAGVSLVSSTRSTEFTEGSRTLRFNDEDHEMRTYTRNFIPPGHLPIFREQMWSWIKLRVAIYRDTRHPIFYSMACPGFAEVRTGFVSRVGDTVPLVTWDENTPE